MKLIRKLADWCVPRSALTNWIVPLRRVDPLQNELQKFQDDRGPYDQSIEFGGPLEGVDYTIHRYSGLDIILSSFGPIDEQILTNGALFVHPLRWHGGLAPWKP